MDPNILHDPNSSCFPTLGHPNFTQPSLPTNPNPQPHLTPTPIRTSPSVVQHSHAIVTWPDTFCIPALDLRLTSTWALKSTIVPNSRVSTAPQNSAQPPPSPFHRCAPAAHQHTQNPLGSSPCIFFLSGGPESSAIGRTSFAEIFTPKAAPGSPSCGHSFPPAQALAHVTFCGPGPFHGWKKLVQTPACPDQRPKLYPCPRKSSKGIPSA